MIRIKSLLISTISILLFMLILSGCGTEQAPKESEENRNDEKGHSESVQLSQDEIEEFGIVLAKASPGKLQIHVTLPGEIIIPPDNLAHIHPRFPGMVKKYLNISAIPLKRDKFWQLLKEMNR